jgi:hypothetical protein
MKCEGTVRNKDGFDTLLAALTHLHDEHAKRLYSGGYVLQCTGCFAKFNDKQGLIPAKSMMVDTPGIVLFSHQDNQRPGNLVG